jgi:hypothetical protein
MELSVAMKRKNLMKGTNPVIDALVRAVLAAGLVLGSAAAIAEDGVDDVIAMGAIDSITAGGSEFSVLGRSYHVDGGLGVSVGDYVAVHGSLQNDGTINDIWVESLGSYVPGADTVYAKGVVTEAQPFLGTFSINGLSYDYTAAADFSGAAAPKLGDVMAVSGTQPAPSGAVLVENLTASAGGALQAAYIKGGGVKSAYIKGGGVQSSYIKGGGVQSAYIKGGGVQSSYIKGGGVQSAYIKGGGVQSAYIKGGGVQSAYIKGGGVKSSYIKGGGVKSSYIKGGGVKSSYIKGGGVASK